MTSIKVGPYSYQIELTDKYQPDGFDQEKWGDLRHDRLVIRLADFAHDDVLVVTLMHECLHALGYSVGSIYQEATVTELAPMLVAFLQDNGVDLGPLKLLITEARGGNRT